MKQTTPIERVGLRYVRDLERYGHGVLPHGNTINSLQRKRLIAYTPRGWVTTIAGRVLLRRLAREERKRRR